MFSFWKGGENFIRCGIYVRVSTDEQRDNRYSSDSQLLMIKEYCEKNEYSIVGVYNDAGYSGIMLMKVKEDNILSPDDFEYIPNNNVKNKKYERW